MVATFSPHRDAGGTLHLPSHSGIHHVDASSAIRQLRRSLSRSPSKSSNFSLLTARSHSPSKSTAASYVPSPLSPSRRSTQSSFVLLPNSSQQQQSPFAVPYPPSAKISRPAMRRTRTSPRSPSKRVLNVSTDQGNAKPLQPVLAPSGEENMPATPGINITPAEKPMNPSDADNNNNNNNNGQSPRPTLSRIEKRRSGTFGSYATVSPLKRSDGIMNLDQASRGSPSAKRRSLHAPNLGAEFSILDNETSASEEPTPDSPLSDDMPPPPIPLSPFSPFATIPKRSCSLRRSTLQQRQSDRSLFGRTRLSGGDSWDFGTPPPIRRMPLDQNLFQPSKESLFSPKPESSNSLFASSLNSATAPGATPQPQPQQLQQQQQQPQAPQPSRQGAHPLSRTITQSSSGSSLVDDSPTHEPSHKNDRPRGINFSKSLPAGATRPAPVRRLYREEDPNPSESFATPENYKLVKPLPAAFMSTGLISKKNRNAEEPQNSLGSSKNMPDTPCKRPINLFPAEPKQTPSEGPFDKSRLLRQSDGVPSSPFNPPSSTRPKQSSFARGMGIFGNSFNKPALSRRSSFASFDDEDRTQSQSPSARFDNNQALNEFDLPPTPTKQSSFPSRSYPPSQFPSFERFSEALGSNGSPSHDRFVRDSPRTPQENVFPPDPSGLSISVPHAIAADFNTSNLPATPTGPRDSFIQAAKRPSLQLNTFSAPDVDPSLTARFENVELVGTGEFSQVFRVSQPCGGDSSVLSMFPSGPKSPGSLPNRVWAVKKAKQPYTGLRDRERRLREVEILKSLANSDHIISFTDSWENYGHLYIQTEYCEEGGLDVFLAEVGLKARLDDFRIWKILLELALGVKHIHDMGFIHLDLKPANILVSFEGVLKIADFGMATQWPAAEGIEGEGDREYIGPEILMGRFDKPADIFSLGLIIFEIAGNVELPDNGVSWQKLRNGDMSDVPSLTFSSESSVCRDASGNPVAKEPSFDDFFASDLGDDEPDMDSFLGGHGSCEQKPVPLTRSGELLEPPSFMVDANHEQALDKIVGWMISPDPKDRPTADQVLQSFGVQFTESRRRAGATVYEGNWGPADEVLIEDTEMIDV